MPIAPDSPELAAIEEVPVRLEVNGRPVLTEVPAAAVPAEGRGPVLASGCGAVSTFRAAGAE